MDKRNRIFAAVLAGVALAVLVGAGAVRAAPAERDEGQGARGEGKTVTTAAAAAASTPDPRPSTPSAGTQPGKLPGWVPPPAGQAGRATPAPSSEKPAPSGPAKTAEAPPPTPIIQVTGRLIHTWYEKPGLKVLLVIDAFTVLTRQEQLVARDGVIWFDEEEAKKTGRPSLGIYAETGVEHKQPDGKVEKYDSLFYVLETPAEVQVHSDESLRGKADNTELFLRAKKMRQEYLTRGVRETPTAVVPPPPPEQRPPVPGIKEAGLPQEITIVAQDDVRQVNFTSSVEDGVRISIWSGGVFLIRGPMEIAADNVVVWTPEETVRKGAGTGAPAGTGGPGNLPGRVPASEAGPQRPAVEAYFEGHVCVNQDRRTLQCSQMYYDFQKEQALAIDTKIRTFTKGRNLPVYYTAKEVRQLAKDIFVGTDAKLTTCEFAHPHYDLAAGKLSLENLTPLPGENPDQPQYARIRYRAEDVESEIRGLPVTYWPRLAGDLAEEETALRSVRIEHRSNRGTGLVTQWHLLKLLGLQEKPEGFNTYLNLDGWSQRGPAIGVDSKYQRKDFYGKFLSYYINDSGKDSVGREDVEPGSQNRGRATWQHRQYLPQNWELTLEMSYISDRNFLDEFFEKENRTAKQQETLVYLKKQEREQALTFLASARVEDFYTRTEYYPQVGYNIIGRSLWDDHLTYFQDSELSVANYRPDDRFRTLRHSGGTLVADTIHELDLPLKLGPVNVVPFAEGRLSYFGEQLDFSGPTQRFSAREGARAATQAWRVYNDVESDFWDVHRLRHVQVFDVSASAAQVSTASRKLIPFQVTEYGTPSVMGVDSTGLFDFGWRNRFQTMRGGPHEKPQSIDWLTVDLEAFFYSNRQFPSLSPDQRREYNHLRLYTQWQTTDSVSLWSETNYNTDRGTLGKFTVGAVVTHTPRLSYVIGHYLIPDGDSAQTFVGFDYQINEKWRLNVLEAYDFDQEQNAQSDFTLTRRLHRWLVRIRVRFDQGQNEKFFGLEFQPLGVKEARFSW